MKDQTIAPFYCIGLAVRTTNQNNQAAQDIPALWQKFFSENTLNRIPGKISEALYCIYLDYEKDHTAPYTTLIGCKVGSLDHIPESMTGASITGGRYTQFTPKGNLDEGLVYNTWLNIWQSGLDRAFTADFEVYGQKAQDRANAEMDIFIALK